MWNNLPEQILGRYPAITYAHGWSFGWSVVINSLMYPIVRLHYTRPLLAWVVIVLLFVFFIWYFQVPIRGLK